MKTQRTLSLAAAAVVLATSSVAARADCSGSGNLVANCGFESGDFTGWTLSGNDVPGTLGNLYGVEGTDPFPLPGGTAPNSGNAQAFFADQVSNTTTMTQSIATTSGTTYTVSFWVAEATVGPGSGNDSLTASFGSGSLTQTQVTDQGYTLYSFSAVASGASTLLSMSFGNDVGEFLVDDVSVNGPAAPPPPPPPPPAIPEPSTLSLLGIGALMLAVRRKALRKD